MSNFRGWVLCGYAVERDEIRRLGVELLVASIGFPEGARFGKRPLHSRQGEWKKEKRATRQKKPSVAKALLIRHSYGTAEQAAEELRKGFLQGLKPVESTQFTSALKHRPPEEKDFFRSL